MDLCIGLINTNPMQLEHAQTCHMLLIWKSVCFFKQANKDDCTVYIVPRGSWTYRPYGCTADMEGTVGS
jgi:hypothetical protein